MKPPGNQLVTKYRVWSIFAMSQGKILIQIILSYFGNNIDRVTGISISNSISTSIIISISISINIIISVSRWSTNGLHNKILFQGNEES